MNSGRLHITRILPEPEERQKLLKSFMKEDGWVTSFSDFQLTALRALANDLEEDADIEFLPFPKVMSRVLTYVRSQSPPQQASMVESKAVLEQVCASIAEDSVFYETRGFQGLHRCLERTLSELRHARVFADQLLEHPDPETASLQRLHSIGAIYEQVESDLRLIGRTHSSQLAEMLIRCDKALGNELRILVLCGQDAHYDWLLALAAMVRLGANVTIAFDTMGPSARFIKKIEAAFGKDLPAPKASAWYQDLFSVESLESHPNLEVTEVADQTAEVEWALRRILQARSDGLLDHRMAIVTPNPKDYVPLLVSHAERFLGQSPLDGQPPLDARLPVPLLSNGFAALILSILKTLSEPNVRRIPRLLQSSYLAIAPELRATIRTKCQELLQNPAESWIVFEQWVQDQGSILPESLPELLAWRQSAVQEPRTISRWHAELAKLLQIPCLESIANQRGNWKAESDRYGLSVMLRALSGLAAVHQAKDEHELRFPQFVETVEALWSREMTTLPTRKDGVRVVQSVDELGITDLVIFLGAVEGQLPPARREDPILFDEDRHLLNTFENIDIGLPDSQEKALGYRSEFLRMIAVTRGTLCFFSPRQAGGNNTATSAYVRELGTKAKTTVHRVLGATAYCPPLEDCRIECDLELRKALEEEHKGPKLVELTDEEISASIRPNFDLHQPIGMLISAADCSFRAVTQYMLGIENRRQSALFSKIMAALRNARITEHHSAEDAAKALETEVDRLQAEMQLHANESDRQLLSTFTDRHFDQLVQREFAAREVWGAAPLSFDSNRIERIPDFRTTFQIGENQIKVSGTIDGLLRINDFFVVRHYLPSVPSQLSAIDENQRYRFMLEIMMLFDKYKDRVAIELDGLGWRRMLLFATGSSGGTRIGRLANANIETFAIDGHQLKAQIREVRMKVADSIRALQAGKMRANPGEYCDTCPFGELCRVSTKLNSFDVPSIPPGLEEA